MSQNDLKCFTCSHYMKNSSCGPCGENVEEIMQNVANSINDDLEEHQVPHKEIIKYSCKIVQKYPKEYENLNPSKCKYYMPSFYKLY